VVVQGKALAPTWASARVVERVWVSAWEWDSGLV